MMKMPVVISRRVLVVLLVLATVGQAVAAFVAAPVTYTTRGSAYQYKSLVSTHLIVNMMPDMMISDLTIADAITSSSHIVSAASKMLFTQEMKEVTQDEARIQFFFLFLGGSGAGGIGLAQIPKIYKEIQEINELAKVGRSQGGEALQTGPLVSFFYNQPLYEKDIQKVISKIPSAAKISDQGTSTTYMASMGYIVQSDFVDAACKVGCNPYAASAVFDAMAGGKAKCVEPKDVDAKTTLYKSNLQAMVQDLQGAATVKLSSYGALAFLLILTFDLILQSGIQGFSS